MNSQKILYIKTGNDEAYTPACGVEPILKYIEDLSLSRKELMLTVWCPFDKKDSEYVRQISKLTFVHVEYSHIDDDQDFFKYEPISWDIIVSNPPFKRKRQFFERALSFGKPFALLMTNTWLNDKFSKWVFKEADREMQLLMFDKRIHFVQNGEVSTDTTFSCSYYCSDFLPKQIILEEINNKG